MSRFKWYRAQWPFSMRELARRLETAAFRDGRMDGFVLDRVRDDLVEGRFVEKLELKEQTTDPFGAVLEFDRVEYRQLKFRISSARPGLELVGSSIGSLSLISKLAEATDFRVTISNCNVDVRSWLTYFEQESQYDGFVDLVQIGSIQLGGSISARAIIKGREDITTAMATLTRDHVFLIEKIQFRLAGKQKGSVLFSNSGGLNVRALDSDQAADFARDALEQLEPI